MARHRPIVGGQMYESKCGANEVFLLDGNLLQVTGKHSQHCGNNFYTVFKS